MKGRLQVGGAPAGRETFDGCYICTIRLHGQHQAAADHRAVDFQRASSADTMLAADMATGEPEFIANEVHQVQTHGHGSHSALAVDRYRDCMRVRHWINSASARLRTTRARCRLVTTSQ